MSNQGNLSLIATDEYGGSYEDDGFVVEDTKEDLKEFGKRNPHLEKIEQLKQTKVERINATNMRKQAISSQSGLLLSICSDFGINQAGKSSENHGLSEDFVFSRCLYALKEIKNLLNHQDEHLSTSFAVFHTSIISVQITSLLDLTRSFDDDEYEQIADLIFSTIAILCQKKLSPTYRYAGEFSLSLRTEMYKMKQKLLKSNFFSHMAPAIKKLTQNFIRIRDKKLPVDTNDVSKCLGLIHILDSLTISTRYNSDSSHVSEVHEQLFSGLFKAEVLQNLFIMLEVVSDKSFHTVQYFVDFTRDIIKILTRFFVGFDIQHFSSQSFLSSSNGEYSSSISKENLVALNRIGNILLDRDIATTRHSRFSSGITNCANDIVLKDKVKGATTISTSSRGLKESMKELSDYHIRNAQVIKDMYTLATQYFIKEEVLTILYSELSYFSAQPLQDIRAPKILRFLKNIFLLLRFLFSFIKYYKSKVILVTGTFLERLFFDESFLMVTHKFHELSLGEKTVKSTLFGIQSVNLAMLSNLLDLAFYLYNESLTQKITGETFLDLIFLNGWLPTNIPQYLRTFHIGRHNNETQQSASISVLKSSIVIVDVLRKFLFRKKTVVLGKMTTRKLKKSKKKKPTRPDNVTIADDYFVVDDENTQLPDNSVLSNVPEEAKNPFEIEDSDEEDEVAVAHEEKSLDLASQILSQIQSDDEEASQMYEKHRKESALSANTFIQPFYHPVIVHNLLFLNQFPDRSTWSVLNASLSMLIHLVKNKTCFRYFIQMRYIDTYNSMNQWAKKHIDVALLKSKTTGMNPAHDYAVKLKKFVKYFQKTFCKRYLYKDKGVASSIVLFLFQPNVKTTKMTGTATGTTSSATYDQTGTVVLDDDIFNDQDIEDIRMSSNIKMKEDKVKEKKKKKDEEENDLGILFVDDDEDLVYESDFEIDFARVKTHKDPTSGNLDTKLQATPLSRFIIEDDDSDDE
ncbi:hypothetical protein PCE1_002326 [Barthelona sp. PCE]